MLTVKPVYHQGYLLVYDMYLDGEWIGSKRTIEQVQDRAKYLRVNVDLSHCNGGESDNHRQ